MPPQSPAHELIEFLTVVSAHPRAEAATAAAAELAAEHLHAEVGAVVIGDALAAATGFGAVGLVHARDGRRRGRPPGPRPLPRGHAPSWDGDRPAVWSSRAATRPSAPTSARSLTGMAPHSRAGAARRGRARRPSRCCASATACSRSCSTSSARSRTASRSSDVLAAITAGASGLLGGCPVALVLDDPLDPERPIVAATTAGGERSESELAIVATAAAQVGTGAPDADGALAASVHINGARAGALVAMAPARPGRRPARHAGRLRRAREPGADRRADGRGHGGGLPRLADRAAQPRAVPRPPPARPRRRGPALDRAVRALRRPRPLQGRQRQHRPRRRRRAAARGGRAPVRMHARGRHRGALRRRRVRRPARGRRARRAARGRRRADHRRHAPALRRRGQGGLHRRHGRHRPRRATPRWAPTSCCATPTSRCTAPRRRAATAPRPTRPRCAPRCWRASSSRPTCATRSSATSCELDYQPVVELAERAHGRRRGARALGAPDARPDPAADLHPGGRGDRHDRRHRALGPARGLPPARRVARGSRPELVLNVNLSAAAAARRPLGRRRRAGAARPTACRARADARDHREHAAVRRRGHRGAPAAPEGPRASRSPSTTSAPATRR